MINKKIFFYLVIVSANCLCMEPATKEQQAQLVQRRLDSNLIRAVKEGDKAKVKSWLSNNANPLAVDTVTNKTAYQLANELGNDEIINLFYTHLHPQKRLPQGIGSMVRKYVEDDVARARTIKEAVNNSKIYIDENPELVGHLIKKKFGQLSLDQELIKASYRDPEYAIMLIKLGANVNAVSNTQYKETAIFIAVNRGWVNLVSALLKAGANVNVQNSNGFTPLMVASDAEQGKNLELINMLILAGADPQLKDNSGKTALDWAKVHLERPMNKNDQNNLSRLQQIIKLLERADKDRKPKKWFYWF